MTIHILHSVTTQIGDKAPPQKPGLAIRALVPFWEDIASHHHAEDNLLLFGAGPGIKLVPALTDEL